MSIKEITNTLTYNPMENTFGGVLISKELSEYIISILNASQVIRNAYTKDIQSEYGPYTTEELYDRCPEIQIWDKLIKEDI